MDIRQELSNIISNKKTPKDLIKELREHKEETAKKIHILEVVDLANSIEEELVQSRVFEKYGITEISLKYKYDNDADVNMLGFECFHEDGSKMSAYSDKGKFNVPHDILWRILRGFDDFTSEYVNQDFLKNKIVMLNTKAGITDQITSILLTKELKTIFDHENLQNNLSQKGTTLKKMKV